MSTRDAAISLVVRHLVIRPPVAGSADDMSQFWAIVDLVEANISVADDGSVRLLTKHTDADHLVRDARRQVGGRWTAQVTGAEQAARQRAEIERCRRY